MIVLGWLLVGAGVTIAALGIRGWRRAGRTLDAILRDEEPE